MSTATSRASRARAPETDRSTPAQIAAAPAIDVVVPVHNEDRVLDTSVRRLHSYLRDRFPFTSQITIVDNASTDGTREVAESLARELEGVRSLRLERKGRGLALKAGWSTSSSAVVAYMDVDLSTGLDALLPLVAPLVSGHSDVAIGSRLAPGSSVARGPKRELISRGYNLMLRALFATQVRDSQCGFKAVRSDVARHLLPVIGDDGWFFDTELVLLAERNGLRIHQVPVDWVDDADTRVEVLRTSIDDVRGSLRLLRSFAMGRGRVELDAATRHPLDDDLGRRLVSFAAIGTLSTIASLVIYLSTRARIGPAGANAVAITATFAANTWANARFTYRARRPTWRGAALVYVGAIGVTSLALFGVGRAGGGPVAEALTLVVLWALASVARFSVVQQAESGRRI